VYRPSRDKKKQLEELLKDLDPATRELARSVLENILIEEKSEEELDELLKKLEVLKKTKEKRQ